MEYTTKSSELGKLFSPAKPVNSIPGSGISIHNIEFSSGNMLNNHLNIDDVMIRENSSFTYPVFVPSSGESKKAIILFHGLNERSWTKYLSWAYYLSEYTGSYVILFPISFHMNRGPVEWRDPRAMMQVLKESESTLADSAMSSFANIALSKRLTEDPFRFFLSGYVTVLDVVDLVKTVKSGNHPVVPRNVEFDIFAYSIGAFMAEILMMGNPENLFSGSKLFMFCGGSVFSSMQGTSKLIMNSRAFDRVYDFYLHDFEKTITRKNEFYEFFNFSTLGMSFRSMIDFSRLRQFRENLLRKLAGQLHSITLRNDSVIPSAGVTTTLNRHNNGNVAEVWDFPYAYSHENPFPIMNNEFSKAVDSCFERMLLSAVNFLGKP
jgi:hypothetical protein